MRQVFCSKCEQRITPQLEVVAVPNDDPWKQLAHKACLCNSPDHCTKMREAVAACENRHTTNWKDPANKDLLVGMMASIETGFCYWCRRAIR